MKHNNNNPRANIALGIAGVILVLFAVILYKAQIVNTEEYKASASAKSYTVEMDASRGIITDCNGNTLVYNEQISILTLNYLEFPTDNDEKNEEILKLIKYLESQDEEWINDLPIEFAPDGTVQFREEKANELSYLRGQSMLDVNYYATAQNCFDVMKEKYNLGGYSDEDALKICAVRYSMSKKDFSARNPYVVSESVSTRTLAYLKENSDFFRGVDYRVATERKYIGDGTTACHILGVVGAISAEEYEEKTTNEKKLLETASLTDAEIQQIELRSYGINDKIGKNGIEAAAEDYLRGTKGLKTITVDGNGDITESDNTLPVSGNTVQLTLNYNMQEVAANSLARRIAAVTSEEAIAQGLSPAGAVVVLDVKNAAVLAMASHPDFPLSTYYENFTALSEDPGKPLWNRCTQSTYSPGSTMKPVIAIAALEEGVIKSDSYINCTGTYEYIDQVFACYNQNVHGVINVETALEHSCNIFFYEMARRIGINTMNEYSELFGLGQKTGIEISESKGILAGIKERDAQGLGWKAGETLLAAIGQSDNSFSILQLANYCSTIANGGIRYTPYLINKVISSDTHETVFEHKPVVSSRTNVSSSTLNTVKRGMYLVANEGSCRNILGHLAYKVACKTGTAEKSKIINGNRVDGTDGFLIAFGPYENPEIAICVCIENAGSGSSTAQVAADIFNYYFSNMSSENQPQKEDTIIW